MIENVGRNVRKLRREREMAQTPLARALGITQQQLSLYENGLRPPLALVERFAAVLGVDVDELFKPPAPRMHQTAPADGGALASV